MSKPLLLLHGAIGAKDQLEPLRLSMMPAFAATALNFSGHGGLPAIDGRVSIRLFAEDVLRWLDAEKLEKVPVFGFSMGGYVALYLAAYHPERIERVATIGTKLAWNPETAAKEAAMLNPERLQEKVPVFAQQLAQRHQPQDWKLLLKQTAHMLQELGTGPLLTETVLSNINIPVLLGLGDRDNMVTIEETLQAYRALPNASLLILPDTIHPVEKLPLPVIALLLTKYFS